MWAIKEGRREGGRKEGMIEGTSSESGNRTRRRVLSFDFSHPSSQKPVHVHCLYGFLGRAMFKIMFHTCLTMFKKKLLPVEGWIMLDYRVRIKCVHHCAI